MLQICSRFKIGDPHFISRHKVRLVHEFLKNIQAFFKLLALLFGKFLIDAPPDLRSEVFIKDEHADRFIKTLMGPGEEPVLHSSTAGIGRVEIQLLSRLCKEL